MSRKPLVAEDTNELRTEQVAREKAARDAALGRRAEKALAGDLGPVLQRWVAGAIVPTADRVRTACGAFLRGDQAEAAAALESGTFGVPMPKDSRHLPPIFAWCLKGSSPGRQLKGSTYADDLVMAVMGTVLTKLVKDKGVVKLGAVLAEAGNAARETALGQFITQVQGAKAMLRVRKSGKAGWTQQKSMDGVAALLAGQVRSALGDAPAEDSVHGRQVVTVLTPKGEQRHIELRRPEAEDWALLNLARHVKGEKDPHAGTWTSFALMVLCAAQAEAGWFDLVSIQPRFKKGGTRFRAAHGLTLSDAADGAIRKDVQRWLRQGFTVEPMLVPPDRGDYLTVKHREVAGRPGPMGIRTRAEGTDAWEVAADVMAGTAWSVPEGTLGFLLTDLGKELAEACEPNEMRRGAVLGAYRRLATRDFYLPIYMDFRGRVYTRPTFVTYQGDDLKKALTVFPAGPVYAWGRDTLKDWDPVIAHVTTLYGGPGKLDKAPMPARRKWFHEVFVDADAKGIEALVREAADLDNEPLQLYTAWSLIKAGQVDRIPCQIDGTCNGLQHLSALFRDEEAAPYVNLVASDREETSPADIYQEVADRVIPRLAANPEPWAKRVLHGVFITRKLAKKPVMVLPYGGTRIAVEEAVLEAIVDQGPVVDTRYGRLCPWRECLTYSEETKEWVRDEEAVQNGYMVFRDRDLELHPLLSLDARLLGRMVWEVIQEVLPKPMAAMETFRSIAKYVGSRSLEWSTSADNAGTPLWVVQAKAKSDQVGLRLKGFHLPGSVRSLQMRVGKDELDPGAHTSGIVANFIHSQDAHHLKLTMQRFRAACGGKVSFGAIHDCFITRPSLMEALGVATREAFHSMYLEDPLSHPVRLRDIKNGDLLEYASWYALADASGVCFPERGKWSPEEVLGSAWFFS